MKYIISVLFIFLSLALVAQNVVTGKVMIKISQGKTEPLAGATVNWQNTSIGRTTNENGVFSIPYSTTYKKLVFSFVGYKTVVVEVNKPQPITQILEEDTSLEEVEVKAEKKKASISYLASANIININEEELLKAACCNLSESFETNPSIDVNFSDALTGNKEIKMLGLTSPYILIAQENIPSVRGASQAFGLTFTPGTWVQSMQITKGAGSVVNGYESIAGQINVELKKPLTDKRLFLNVYSSLNGRQELNAQFKQKVTDKWSTSLFLHGNQRTAKIDKNKDGFLGIPLAKQVNFMNRWQYTDAEKGFVSFINLRYLKDDKQTGETDFNPDIHKLTTVKYGSEINTERFDVSGKLGYVFPDTPYNSISIQSAYSNHDQGSYFGLNQYNINHKSVYSNIIFRSIISNTFHKFKTGLSYTYDAYNEFVNTQNFPANFNRDEKDFGAFFEYSHDNLDNFSLIAGLRVDFNNLLGTFITPRLHLRYVPFEKTVLRASAGRGKRSANIFAENMRLFGSSRKMEILNTNGNIYGLNPEIAWNYGVSFLQGFMLFDKKAELTLDYYSTLFDNQVVVDIDESPQQVLFYNLNGKSFANNFQAQLNVKPIKHLELRLAYKHFDVKTDYLRGRLEKSLIPKHRFFANIGYETHKKDNGSQWKFDYTFNWLGKQRLPITSSNPVMYQLADYSPSYSLMNAQVTRVFSKKFEVYLGGENLTGYTQAYPILASDTPFSQYFDTSIVYAPVLRAMYYAGLRFTIK